MGNRKRHFVFRDHDSGEVVFECDAVSLRAAKHQRYYWRRKCQAGRTCLNDGEGVQGQ